MPRARALAFAEPKLGHAASAPEQPEEAVPYEAPFARARLFQDLPGRARPSVHGDKAAFVSRSEPECVGRSLNMP